MLRAGLLLALVFAAAPLPAQIFKLGGGTSSLLDAQGGSLEVRGPNYESWMGLGQINGQLRIGAFARTRWRGYTFTLGDDTIRFGLPTDVFQSGQYFLGRGVGMSGVRKNVNFFAFAGATSTHFGTLFLKTAVAEDPVGVLFLDTKLSGTVRAFSRNVLSRQLTSIHGLEWKTRDWLKTAVAAGTGANQGYMATSMDADKGWIAVRASYVGAGSRFHRVTTANPLATEVDRENIVVTVHPKPNLTITASHQNFLQPASADRPAVRANVQQVSAGADLAGFRFGGGIYHNRAKELGNLGTSLWAARRLNDRLDLSFNYFRAAQKSGIISNSVSGTIREIISPRFDLLQLVTYSNGQTTVSFGGNLNSNRFSVGVDYQTVYVPFLASAFKQALMLRVRFRPFGNVELNTQTYVAPDGRIRYTAAGNTFLYRYQGLVVGEPSATFNLPRNMARGRVTDENGDPIRGAALRIDRQDVFTDANGQFFVRVKKAREYPVQVLVDEFLVPGYFEVVDAPASVKAESEEQSEEIIIVVRRTRPPLRPSVMVADAAKPAAGHEDTNAGLPDLAALEPPTSPPVDSPASEPGSKSAVSDSRALPAPVQVPVRDGYAVQVAALSQPESVAALVEALRRQRYPVYVIGGEGVDGLYRVQVGPFLDRQEARSVRSRLIREGYKPIVKDMAFAGPGAKRRDNQGD